MLEINSDYPVQAKFDFNLKKSIVKIRMIWYLVPRVTMKVELFIDCVCGICVSMSLCNLCEIPMRWESHVVRCNDWVAKDWHRSFVNGVL